MALQNLPISRLINVQVVLTPTAAQAQNLNALLVLGNSDVIDVVTRIRQYLTLSSVANDFGTSAPEYLAAQEYFGQSPQPSVIYIGRWAKTATKGELFCAPLSATNQLLATWTAITTGSMKVTVDGGSLQSLTALDFHLATSLTGVAAVITAALTGATCTYNANYNRFQIESATTGMTSSVSFLTAGASGVDITGMLAGLSTSSGAYVAAGIAAESAVSAAQLFDTLFGQQWYALFIPEAVDADHIAIAPAIQGMNNKHLYGVNTSEAGVLSSASTTDIAYILSQLGLNYTRTIVQYSSTNSYAIASFLGRLINVNYGGQNTTITMMYKQEPGVIAESLTPSQITTLEAKNCNVFVAYNNNTAIVEPGITAGGVFADIVTGTDWLAVTIMTALYNLLYTSPTKIPQTDAGMGLLRTTCEAVCIQGVQNGLLAPGVWQSAGFGILNQGDFLPKGFYVYNSPVATQSQALRAARQSMPIQIAAKLAGAIHDIGVTINVNQ